MRRALVIALQGLGNLVLATPVMTAMAEAGYELSLVTRTRAVARLLEAAPWVATVDSIDVGWGDSPAAGWRQRRGRPEVSVTCFPDGRRAAALAVVAGARRRVGFVDWLPAYLRRAYTAPLRAEPGLHDVEQNLRVLDAVGVRRREPPMPVVPLTSADASFADDLLSRPPLSETGSLVAVHAGGRARGSARRWPEERYHRVVTELCGRDGVGVVLVGGESERPMLQRIAEGAAGRAVVLAGRATLAQTAAVIARCAAYVGNDSGPLHVAAAVGTRVVGLYGPTDERRTAPWGEGHTVLTTEIPCRPCYRFGERLVCRHGSARCLEGIGVEDVMAAILAKLEPRGSGAATEARARSNATDGQK